MPQILDPDLDHILRLELDLLNLSTSLELHNPSHEKERSLMQQLLERYLPELTPQK